MCCAPSTGVPAARTLRGGWSCAERLDLGRCREAPDRVVLVLVGLEHGQQLRNRQEVRDSLRQVQQLEATALPAHRRIRANDFTEAGAVDVRDVGEIQDDLLLALIDEAVDLVLE